MSLVTPERHRRLRIALLCEGDPRTWDSLSGITKSVLDGLQGRGHKIFPLDVDLKGASRLWWIARSFSPDRRRWWVRYHLGPGPFLRRSIWAQQLVDQIDPKPDVLLQFGATFETRRSDSIPTVLYCDGNIAVAKAGRSTGFSDAAHLTDDEISGVWGREASVYARAHSILTISDRLKRSFTEDFGIPEERVCTAFAGANLPDYPTDSALDRPMPTTPTVLFVGRDFERKGGALLIDAYTRVRSVLPNARLVIIGPDRPPHVDDGVIFLGRLDKDTRADWLTLRNAYLDATVFCMPTKYEGLSIAVMEAMHFGLPCITTFNDWSHPETVVPGTTGVVVPSDNVDALSDALLDLLREPAKARRLGLEGRQRAQSLFTWDVVCDKIERALLAASRDPAWPPN